MKLIKYNIPILGIIASHDDLLISIKNNIKSYVFLLHLYVQFLYTIVFISGLIYFVISFYSYKILYMGLVILLLIFGAIIDYKNKWEIFKK